MSNKLVSQLYELLLPRPYKDILRVLCDAADDDPARPGFGFNCYPSIPVVAWKSDYSERQVKRILRSVEGTLQLLVPLRIHPNYGTTEYEIHLERAPRKPPFVRQSLARGGRNSLRVRGDTMSPLGGTFRHPQGGHSSVTPRDVKTPTEGVTKSSSRGDTALSPNPLLPLSTQGAETSPLPPPRAEGATKRERRPLTRREQKRLRQAGDFNQSPEFQIFSSRRCDLCPTPHEFSSQPYASQSIEKAACPESMRSV